MTIKRIYRPLRLVIPLVLIALLTVAARAGAQVRDGAGFFSPAAVEKANAQIKEIRQQSGKDLLIESIPSVPDDLKDQLAAQGKDRFFSSYAAQRAKAAGIDGIYILITKDPSYLKVAVGNETARKAFTTANRDELASLMLSAFKQKQYDQGLEQAVDFVRRTLSSNSAATGVVQRSSTPAAGPTAYPSRPSQPVRQGPGLLFWLVIGIVAFLAIRFIMRLVSRGSAGGLNQQQQYPPQAGTGPYGAPPPLGGGYGYGAGGGGGFGRGILGGLLGGLAGGWMMDQYRNRQDPSSYGGATPPPLPPTDPNAGGGVFGDAHDTSFSTNEGGAFGDSGTDFGGGGDTGGGDFGGGGDSGGGGDF